MLFLIHLIGGFYCATKLSILEDSAFTRLLFCIFLGWVFIVIYLIKRAMIVNGYNFGTFKTVKKNTEDCNLNKNDYQNSPPKSDEIVGEESQTLPREEMEIQTNINKRTNNENVSTKQELKPIFTNVIGVSFNGQQTYVQHCYKGQHLKVVRDTFSAYNPKTIALYADENLVGFIKKELAIQLADEIDNGIEFDCVVEDVTAYTDHTYGITIKLSEVEDLGDSYSENNILENEGYGNDELFYAFVCSLSKKELLEAVSEEYYKLKGTSNLIPYTGVNGCFEFAAALLLWKYAVSKINNMKELHKFGPLLIDLAHVLGCSFNSMFPLDVSDKLDLTINVFDDVLTYPEWSKVYRYLKNNFSSELHEYEFVTKTLDERSEDFRNFKKFLEVYNNFSGFKSVVDYYSLQGLGFKKDICFQVVDE